MASFLKYPIGKFELPIVITNVLLNDWIKTIKDFPTLLKQETDNLSEEDLSKTYRPGSWNIRQLVHHCADSHMNSFIRFKLTLTEEVPTIKPYTENLWAELPDSAAHPIDSSLQILEGLHKRWGQLLNSLSNDDLEKQFHHPESNEYISLKTNIGIYAWHCQHHLAHIRLAKNI